MSLCHNFDEQQAVLQVMTLRASLALVQYKVLECSEGLGVVAKVPQAFL